MNENFWNKKKVLITGNRGFKGSWLSLTLLKMNSFVIGIDKNKEDSILNDMEPNENFRQLYGDLSIKGTVKEIIDLYNPEIIFHLAAQPLVDIGWENPQSTLLNNINSSINLFFEISENSEVKKIINVTTDKVYGNNEESLLNEQSYLEGDDPYSVSKVCGEQISNIYRKINPSISITNVRGGNVIGGGDMHLSRLFPNIINHFEERKKLKVRNPLSSRPWQYILDIISGYMLAAEHNDLNYINFGPTKELYNVKDILNYIQENHFELYWSHDSSNYKEKKHILLDSEKAYKELNWKPKVEFTKMIDWSIDWEKRRINGENRVNLCNEEIDHYKQMGV